MLNAILPNYPWKVLYPNSSGVRILLDQRVHIEVVTTFC